MASSSLLSTLTLLFLVSVLRLTSSLQSHTPPKKPFFALPLVSRTQSHPHISPLQTSFLDPKTSPRPPSSSTKAQQGQSPQGRAPFKFPFKYTMALVVSLPIGTPPQAQPMVLDTGSQLSWVQCHNKTPLSPHSRNPSSLKTPPPNTPKTPTPAPSSTTFDPSLSSSFSLLPCNTPSCNPTTPDFTLPTSCDSNRLCHYSYFYADGTLAEGNLVQEKISLSPSTSTSPIVLGCSHPDASAASSEGILGLNLGRLSFVSQASVRKFSYCVPPRRRNLTAVGAAAEAPAVGTFLLGENPFSGGFRYAGLLRFTPEQRRLPNLDAAAFSVAVAGVRVNGRRLPIPRSAFVPDAGGSGQTMVDSGTEFTFLVEAAYAEVRAAAARLAGPRLKKDYVYGGALDTCFQGRAAEIGRLLWEVAIEMEGGAELVAAGERALVDVGGGVSCLAIGSSQLLGVPSNIIGNFHQQNMWIEFDVLNNRVGFGKADCTKPL